MSQSAAAAAAVMPADPVPVKAGKGKDVGQHKNWCFTSFGPAFPKNLQEAGCHQLKANYLVYQPEKCPDTGRLHVQGFLQLGDKKRLSQLVKAWPGCHFESMRGTTDEAGAYCKKDESYFAHDGIDRYEFGVCRKQGGRADIDLLKSIIVEKGGLKRIAEDHPEEFLRYTKLERWGEVLRPSRPNRPRQLLVYYGAPGTGKSFTAYRDFGDDMYTPASNNSGVLSFETYAQQSCILIDDFMPGQIGAGALKTMTDRYPNKLIGRNVSPENMADTIIITSNLDPRVWFSSDPTFFPALVRRCASMIECRLSETHLIEWWEVVSDGKLLDDMRRVDAPDFE